MKMKMNQASDTICIAICKGGDASKCNLTYDEFVSRMKRWAPPSANIPEREEWEGGHVATHERMGSPLDFFAPRVSGG